MPYQRIYNLQTAVIKTDILLTHQLYAACKRGKKWMKRRGEGLQNGRFSHSPSASRHSPFYRYNNGHSPPYLHLLSNNTQIESPVSFWFGEALYRSFDSMGEGFTSVDDSSKHVVVLILVD